jgi:hypothetical protein
VCSHCPYYVVGSVSFSRSYVVQVFDVAIDASTRMQATPWDIRRNENNAMPMDFPEDDDSDTEIGNGFASARADLDME